MNYALPFNQGQKLIELGGGETAIIRPNCDVRQCYRDGQPCVDIIADLNDPLPLASNDFDGVFASYVIEHLSYRKVKGFISEVNRILKPEGIVVFITANTKRQMEWVLAQDEWNDDSSSIIFGDQNYAENTHRNSLCPEYAIKLLQDAGFDNIVVIPWGEFSTDMVIEARKAKMNTEDRKSLFDKHYFNGGGKVGGYANEGFRDFPVHYITFKKLLELKPQSVLEIGAGRGYLVKRFQDIGIPASGLEISHHCWLTRACNSIIEWDICQFPWPLADQSYDLGYSIATLEHIPEEFVSGVLSETSRVCRRAVHGIDFGEKDDGFDKTHCTLRSKQWWEERLPKGQLAFDKEDLESKQYSIVHYLPEPDDKLKVNIGSFINMFHGWCNVDLLDLHAFARQEGHKFLQHDVRQGLPFGDKTVDLMYSSHFLEHLTYEDGRKFLQECKRVMKSGGCIRLMLPDVELLATKFLNRTLTDYNEINDGSAAASTDAAKFWQLIFSGHLSCYDFETLRNAALSVGFLTVERRAFREGNIQILQQTVDMLPELSLFVEISA